MFSVSCLSCLILTQLAEPPCSMSRGNHWAPFLPRKSTPCSHGHPATIYPPGALRRPAVQRVGREDDRVIGRENGVSEWLKRALRSRGSTTREAWIVRAPARVRAAQADKQASRHE